MTNTAPATTNPTDVYDDLAEEAGPREEWDLQDYPLQDGAA